jgi:RHS repeat-associated protein
LPPYRFHSQLLNSNSDQLYYMNARYYDAELNRFISRDPFEGHLTDPQSQNPYSYALNNPINFSDPSGEIAILPALGVSGAIGAAAGVTYAYANNPCATAGELARAGGVGFAAGAAGGAAALYAGAVAASAGAGAVVSNIVGGAASGVAGSVTSNALNGQPLLENAGGAAVLGGATGGVGGSVADDLAPVGPGRPPNTTLIGGGLKAGRELNNHTVGESVSTGLCLAFNCSN